MGQADPIAEVAGECLVCVGCWGFVILPPSPFDFKGELAIVLKGQGSLLVGMSSGLAICSESRPIGLVDVTGAEGLLQTVFIARLWNLNITVEPEERSPCRGATLVILHPGDDSRPTID